MPARDSLPRRLAAVASVVVGLGLIGASADGVMALESDLEAATAPAVPSRLAEDRAPGERDGRCRRSEYRAPRSPEV
ncbi:MAG: hypothetical protein AVDCRST_MAG38-715 [uncultured Solirubrobacteraceae bacterium]|uniref:Uncharacterized protein n=1 Tax=uncultured Solirubrobacteraceae bacterium TaxID=1162706 RepID=A0A6J4RDJ0_9ACTN|nr:MAG: hypothetical protein AVDCRST_MAG38-715 [uncultured Solirubrobacteraceae bacterium]